MHEFSKHSKKLFRKTIAHFIIPEHLNDYKINCKNPRNFLPLENIDLGLECKNFLLELPDDVQTSIRKSCLEFMITAATDMQIRFPLTDPFFDALEFLNPHIALTLTKPKDLTSLKIVWSKFISINDIDGNAIDSEWKNISVNFSDDIQKESLLQLSVEEFWEKLRKFKDFNDEPEYS